jgi:glutathionylspermidine synthase
MTTTVATAAAVGLGGLQTRRLSVSHAEWAGVLRSLRFRHFKWDTFGGGGCLVLPEAIVLPRALHEEAVRIAEGLHAALGRFEGRVRHDREALRRLAIPDGLHPLIAEERHGVFQLARYDLFPTEDGRWMVSEFNEDVPGGFNEAALPDLVGDPGAGLRWEGDLRAALLDAFKGYEAVAMLYATAFSEDLQHMLVVERWLAEAGHRTVLGSPAHLRRGLRRPRVLGLPVDAAFRFYPAEWMPRLPNFGTWLRVGPGLPMMNPVYRLVRQSKTMFALWREDPALSPEDRALLDRHVPHTEPFDPARLEAYRDERERWVLKRAFGRMGDAVTLGALVSEADWSAALAEAARQPGEFSVQERFVVPPLAFEAGPLYPALGVFLVNGRFAGYYSRASRSPITTHEAFHVATLVQTA